MRSESDGRRLGKRFKRKLDVELHIKGKSQLVRATDVSRHGLFLTMPDPPPENHVVLLTVHLPDAPFETMALVARRVLEQGDHSGAGLKLYCLASDAKQRWDHFLESLSGAEYSISPRAAPENSGSSASFLVQLGTVAEIEEFFRRHVRHDHVVHVTPALKELGAEVLLVLVHPETSKEFVLRAVVAELYPDRPMRMGIRFVDADMAKRAELRRFLGLDRAAKNTDAPEPQLVPQLRSRFTEYAFYSPKVLPAATAPAEPLATTKTKSAALVVVDTSAEELATVEGELLDLEELALVDKKALFDFNWWNEE